MSDIRPHLLLRQAPPFLFVDRVIEVAETGIVCLKQISYNEPYLAGHFPGDPIVPGVLLVEMCAQACLILAQTMAHGDDRPPVGYLVKIADFTFHRPARPGDSLAIHVSKAGETGGYRTMKADVLHSDSKERVCRGSLVVCLPQVKAKGSGE